MKDKFKKYAEQSLKEASQRKKKGLLTIFRLFI